MTEYTQSALDILYDHLILSDCICIDHDNFGDLTKYTVHSLLHALEGFTLNKKSKVLLDIVRKELAVRNGVKND